MPTLPVSQLLERAHAGDQPALNELVTALYGELRRIAARLLRSERHGHTLQTTALVHEAYLKLFENEERRYADKVHFLAVASRVMRQVLVDYARARSTKKRGGSQATLLRVTWTASLDVEGKVALEPRGILELDQALDALEVEDKSLAQLIEMRYFGGMTAEETAEVLKRSVHTVRHDLRLAQAWLRRHLSPKRP